MGIKIYNSPPPEIKDLSSNIKKFKSSLRGVVHQHSFYAMEEHFIYNATDMRRDTNYMLHSSLMNL